MNSENILKLIINHYKNQISDQMPPKSIYSHVLFTLFYTKVPLSEKLVVLRVIHSFLYYSDSMYMKFHNFANCRVLCKRHIEFLHEANVTTLCDVKYEEITEKKFN